MHVRFGGRYTDADAASASSERESERARYSLCKVVRTHI